MIAVSLLLFPKLALGLSRVRDRRGGACRTSAAGRTTTRSTRPGGSRNTRKLLLTAAVIMSVYLLGSSIVVSTLIPPDEITPVSADGRAAARTRPASRSSRSRTGRRSRPPAGRWRTSPTAKGRTAKDDLPAVRGDVRHDLRHQHHRHPLVRRGQRDGRAAEPGAAVPAAVRHGPGVGAGDPAARAAVHRHQPARDLGVQGERGRPGRGLRHRRAGAHHQRLRGRGHRRVPARGEGPWYRRLSVAVRAHHRWCSSTPPSPTRSRRASRG